MRDFRRMSQQERPADSSLPTFSMSLDRENLDALNSQLYGDGKRSYVNGYIQNNGTIHDVQARYRGNKPWHWIGNQKSIKLRLDRGDLIDGTRIFNLLNDPTPFGMEVPIIFDIARGLGLITPDYHMVRVRLNNTDMGVYHYASQPVEGVLRRGRRMPGAIYSGDTDSVDVARGVGGCSSTARAGNRSVNACSVKRMSTSRSSDCSTPCRTRAMRSLRRSSNSISTSSATRHSTRSTWSSAATSTTTSPITNSTLTRIEAALSRSSGDFAVSVTSRRSIWMIIRCSSRLKMTPGYTVLRNRAVFELLTGMASVPQVRNLADRLFEEVAPRSDHRSVLGFVQAAAASDAIPPLYGATHE